MPIFMREPFLPNLPDFAPEVTRSPVQSSNSCPTPFFVDSVDVALHLERGTFLQGPARSREEAEMQEPPGKLLDLSGQAACVTGAGRGIGKSIATLLASAGAAVLVTDINGDEAADVAAAIVGEGGRA